MQKTMTKLITVFLVAFVAIPISNADSDKPVLVNIMVSAEPCGGVYEKDPRPCISPYIFPQAHIEIYELGKDKVASVDLPNTEQPLGKKGVTETILNAGDYIILIENKSNEQKTLFGPVTVAEDFKEMEFRFQMHNTPMGENQTSSEPKEICFAYKTISFNSPNIGPAIEIIPKMQCHVEASVLNGTIVTPPFTSHK